MNINLLSSIRSLSIALLLLISLTKNTCHCFFEYSILEGNSETLKGTELINETNARVYFFERRTGRPLQAYKFYNPNDALNPDIFFDQFISHSTAAIFINGQEYKEFETANLHKNIIQVILIDEQTFINYNE